MRHYNTPLDSPDDDGDLFLAYMLMSKQSEDENEDGEELSQCYLCHGTEDLESAHFPDSSTLVCVDCSVSWQHEHNLEDEWRLEGSDV